MEWVGIALACVGTLSSAIGMHFIRRGEETGDVKRTAFGNLMIVVVGSLLEVTALGFTPESTIAPLGGLTIPFTVCIVAVTERKCPSARVVVGALCVVAGCAAVVAVGPPMRKIHPEELKVGLAFATGVAYCSAVLVFGIADFMRDHPAGAGLVAGVVGGFSNTMSKAGVEAGALKHKSVALFTASALMFAGIQIALLNVALKSFPPMSVNPTYMVTLMLSVVLLGAETYDEFRDIDALHILAFTLGVSLAAAGTWILAAGPTHAEPPPEPVVAAVPATAATV